MWSWLTGAEDDDKDAKPGEKQRVRSPFKYEADDADLLKDKAQLVQRFQQVFDEMNAFFEDDRAFRAHILLDLLDRSLSLHEPDPELAALRARLHDGPHTSKIREQVSEVNRMVIECLDDDGWTLSASSPRTMYKSHPASPVHSIRMEGVINTPGVNLIALVNEIDLYTSWFPLISSSRELASLGRFVRLAHVAGGVPFFADRDGYAYGYGVDLREDGSIVIMIRTIESYPGVETPPVASGSKRIDIRFAGFWVSPGPRKGTTRLRVIANFDPKLWYIPTVVINWFTRQLAPFFWKMMSVHARRISRDPSKNRHAKRMAKKREVYGVIEERVAEYWKNAEAAAAKQGITSDEHEPATEDDLTSDSSVPAVPAMPKGVVLALGKNKQSDEPDAAPSPSPTSVATEPDVVASDAAALDAPAADATASDTPAAGASVSDALVAVVTALDEPAADATACDGASAEHDDDHDDVENA